MTLEMLPRIAVLLAACNTACAHVRTIDRAALIVSSASIVCDWASTDRYASDGWIGVMESNPILGPRPDRVTLAGYFFTALSLNLAVWLAVPKGYRAIVPAIVTVGQVKAIHGNATFTPKHSMAATHGACGL